MKKITVAIAFLGFIACKPKNQVNVQPNTEVNTEEVKKIDSLNLLPKNDSLPKETTTPGQEIPKKK